MTHRTPRAVRRTASVTIDEIVIAGRLVNATFAVEFLHQPAQVMSASPCYYDSPPDPQDNYIEAIAVVDWTEYDVAGNDLDRVLTQQQIIETALPLIEDDINDR